MRYSANLSFLFQELPFLDRIDAAAQNGFRGVEYMSPYDFDAGVIKERLRTNGVEQVLFNLPAGDFAQGERGFAYDPERVDEFREGVDNAVDYARALGCTRVNMLVGIAKPGLDGAYARATLVKNARYAAKALDAIGATLLVEPLNRIDTPGFIIGTTGEALALIAEVGAKNFKLQYDMYHAQRVEGNQIATIRAHAAQIAHVQIADSPGRNEPGTGELAYERILPVLDEVGYDGWVGLEYKPSRPAPQTFDWVASFRTPEVAVS
jgi:hydroxypyruvate isomerase